MPPPPRQHSEKKSSSNRAQFQLVVSAWLVLAIGFTALACRNTSAPGLYYDEAVFAGLAKDFIAGHGRLHMPGTEVVSVFGRPFPLFVQFYLGALKSWMLMPGLAISGFNLATVRLTNWSWSLLSLLFFMLGVRRLLGPTAAVISGAILISDPTYFFLSLFDWGAAISSLFCRCLAFYLVLVWWQYRRSILIWLASFLLGLGLFNKFDFAAFLTGTLLAACAIFPRQLVEFIRKNLSVVAGCTAGFLLGAGPIIFKIALIMKVTAGNGAGPGETVEKLHTLLAMYDGSYFYRLMEAAGRFTNMYTHPTQAHSLLGLVFLVAIVVLITTAIRTTQTTKRQIALFFLLALALTTIGALLIPGAVRIHHSILAFPFPQLMIAATAIFLWKREWNVAPRLVRGGIVALLLVQIASQLFAISKTEELISHTGGRGWWSNTLETFCQENKNRSDLTIISLDWGFNEQVSFLTDAPQLVEPFWALAQRPELPPLPRLPQNVYLAHAPEYTLFGYDVTYLDAARTSGDPEIRAYPDREGHVVFYTIQFPAR